MVHNPTFSDVVFTLPNVLVQQLRTFHTGQAGEGVFGTPMCGQHTHTHTHTHQTVSAAVPHKVEGALGGHCLSQQCFSSTWSTIQEDAWGRRGSRQEEGGGGGKRKEGRQKGRGRREEGGGRKMREEGGGGEGRW